jgi:hypothetical protein
MTDLENAYLTGVIVDSIKDAILTDSDAPSLSVAAMKHFDAGRPRVFSKLGNRLVDSLEGTLRQLAKAPCRPRIYKDAIAHNLPARCRLARISA